MFKGHRDDENFLGADFCDLPTSARVEDVFVKFACQKKYRHARRLAAML
jgi:hypothetical protein